MHATLPVPQTILPLISTNFIFYSLALPPVYLRLKYQL